MAPNHRYLPLAPRLTAFPGKSQASTTRAQTLVTQRPGSLPMGPYREQTSSLPQIAETYAFLPREAVTRFLMSCTECQKRMHFNSNGLEPKGR